MPQVDNFFSKKIIFALSKTYALFLYVYVITSLKYQNNPPFQNPL